MKHLNVKTTLTAVALAALLWAAPASAQTQNLRFDIPFSFIVGTNMLPAGQYETTIDQFARMVLRNTAENKLYFVGLTGRYEAREGSTQQGQLRFERHAGTLFLTVAWAPGKEDGRTLLPSGRLLEASRYVPRGAAEIVTITSDQK